ncbi:uncharacterized protein LOC126681156 [Mercurialis annua]|uniref:uncharacterized protein LOC126681156 n=1 Tax=Mercurialis annua TaxID=3986 RepID=UPI002160B8BF|nr:uncharacterized protein LOC126681156 [Mercurialis annua]
MDSEEEEEIEMEENRDFNTNKMGIMMMIKYVIVFVLRLSLAFLIPIMALFCISIVTVILGILAANFFSFSFTSPILFPTHCTILSASVDLRSSKVCELGLLNYNDNHVFYPFDSSKFRCRFDYYWASVFQVEYKDQSLGQRRLALAEAPNEALPQDCRPNFAAAWLTKDLFKVNNTYDCWYSVGFSKVSLYRDGFFPCQAKDPSASEMLRRYVFLSIKTLRSLFVQKKGNANYWRWETVAGIVTGFSTSLISISFISIIHHMKSRLSQTYAARMFGRTIKMVFFKRICFLVAYLSIAGWLALQYGKRLGLSEIYKRYTY